jgi:hypothetical protein
MRRQSGAVRADARRQMSPPIQRSVVQISEKLGIHVVTLSNWRKAWRLQREVVWINQPSDKLEEPGQIPSMQAMTEASQKCSPYLKDSNQPSPSETLDVLGCRSSPLRWRTGKDIENDPLPKQTKPQPLANHPNPMGCGCARCWTQSDRYTSIQPLIAWDWRIHVPLEHSKAKVGVHPLKPKEIRIGLIGSIEVRWIPALSMASVVISEISGRCTSLPAQRVEVTRPRDSTPPKPPDKGTTERIA